MKGCSNCQVCGNEFIWRRAKTQKPPQVCNNKCRGHLVKKFLKRKFIWDNATEDERKRHIEKCYEKNIIRKEGCWDWKKKSNRSNPYIEAKRGGSKIPIHRFSWIKMNGSIPDGMCVLHICDNPRCSRPEHLFLGSNDDNIRDMIKKGRNAKGSKHGCAKLNEEKVIEIKKLLSIGVTCSRIAKEYEMSSSTIKRIKNGKLWRHVTC